MVLQGCPGEKNDLFATHPSKFCITIFNIFSVKMNISTKFVTQTAIAISFAVLSSFFFYESSFIFFGQLNF